MRETTSSPSPPGHSVPFKTRRHERISGLGRKVPLRNDAAPPPPDSLTYAPFTPARFSRVCGARQKQMQCRMCCRTRCHSQQPASWILNDALGSCAWRVCVSTVPTSAVGHCHCSNSFVFLCVHVVRLYSSRGPIPRSKFNTSQQHLCSFISWLH